MTSNQAAMPLMDLIGAPQRTSIGTEAVDRVVHAIRQHLGMDVAFVAEFRKSDRIFRHVNARDRSPVHPGDVVSLDDGYCQKVIDGRLPELIPDTRRVPAASALPETHAIPIGSHLSVPIRLADGRVFGTFCCFSFLADPSLGDRDLKMMRVFAALLADQIDRDMAAQQSTEQGRQQITAAIAAGQPDIVFQPIYNLEGSRLAGLEALSRFAIEPQRPPDAWFAAAADVGLGTALELAAIRGAIQALPSLPQDAYLAVNCGPRTILDPALARCLEHSDVRRVVLEITEHDYIQDYPSLLAALAPLRALGLRVAIDDAGAGYASLRHVLHIQPELIKLDVSLTRGIDTDPTRRALASALIAFARETGARIVAEGVETEAELRELRRLGAGFAQGYFLARPLPLREALAHRLQEPTQRVTAARGARPKQR